MDRVRVSGSWAAAVLIAAVWAATAHGQSQMPQFQYTPPPSSGPSPVSNPDDYFRQQRDFAQNWENKQKQEQQQKVQQTVWWPGGGEPEAPTLEHLMTWGAVALTGLVAVLLVLVGAKVFLRRWSGPADPMKAAMNDPWIRAQRAKSGALPNNPPPPGSSVPRY